MRIRRSEEGAGTADRQIQQQVERLVEN